jgi:hypothetical protein
LSWKKAVNSLSKKTMRKCHEEHQLREEIMRKKNQVFYLAYVLILLSFFVFGSFVISRYRDNASRNGFEGNSYALMVGMSLLFPFLSGLLFSAEHVFFLIIRKEQTRYNWPRFFCFSIPLLLIFAYSNISYYDSIIHLYLPHLIS